MTEDVREPDDTGHGHPDLAGLLRAELGNDEVLDFGAHLETCDACRHELSDLAVGHALLARTARTLGPAPDVSSMPAPTTAPTTAPTGMPALPPLDSTRRQRMGGGLSRAARPLALVAAAAVLVAGTAVVTERVTRPAPVPAADQTAALAPVTGNGGGEVLMATHDNTVTMTIETHDLPRATSNQFYYAWLLDPATDKMLPLGQVGPSGVASFQVPVSLLDRYTAVDVSLEDDDGDPGHSVTSVLRGSYQPEPAQAAPAPR